jgi:predicted RNA-binding protein YlqC (UPF0109 family)
MKYAEGDEVMKHLITLIAKALVDHPEQVRVREVGGNHTEILELEVAKVDIGKVIGRRGRTAQAMRTILGAASAKGNKRAVLEIVDQKLDRPKLL